MSDLIKDLGKILDDCNMQVTFTGWKAELEIAEKTIENLKKEVELLESCIKVYANAAFEIKGEIYAVGSKAKDALSKLKELRGEK